MKAHLSVRHRHVFL